MKYPSLFIILMFIFSCGKDKVVQLPEIDNATISEVNDISAAYIFYNENEPDSVELNRNNLISTTNWLFNVDKRLTLKQVVPQIKLLQEKRRNAQLHKNENARNYFTCNDTSKKTLGFIDFTDVVYVDASLETDAQKVSEMEDTTAINTIGLNLSDIVSIITPNQEPFVTTINSNALIDSLKKMDTTKSSVILNFNKSLSFQDYITYKSMLSKNDFKHLEISHEEFLYN